MVLRLGRRHIGLALPHIVYVDERSSCEVRLKGHLFTEDEGVVECAAVAIDSMDARKIPRSSVPQIRCIRISTRFFEEAGHSISTQLTSPPQS